MVSKSVRNARRRRRGRRRNIGAPPGHFQIDPQSLPTQWSGIAYGPEGHEELQQMSLDSLPIAIAKWPVVWVQVVGLGSGEVLRQLAGIVGIHALALEDIVHLHQRAKLDEYEDHLYLVARMMEQGEAEGFRTEQISFILRDNLLVTFEERPGDCWDPVRQRIRQRRGAINSLGTDYLLYSLLDAVVDSYFPAMDRLNERLDLIEEEIMRGCRTGQMESIHQLRGDLLNVRRAIRPHREMVNELIRDHHPSIREETRLYLRDCYDHVSQLIDLVDTSRELTSDLRDFYLSSISNHMNEVMKVLTIMSSIFIPLSFVAGVYGMNFDPEVSPWNMPELKWYLGYPMALAIMAAMAIGLLIYFRRRGWIGAIASQDEPPTQG